jgi:hypothetical protein
MRISLDIVALTHRTEKSNDAHLLGSQIVLRIGGKQTELSLVERYIYRRRNLSIISREISHLGIYNRNCDVFIGNYTPVNVIVKINVDSIVSEVTELIVMFVVFVVCAIFHTNHNVDLIIIIYVSIVLYTVYVDRYIGLTYNLWEKVSD